MKLHVAPTVKISLTPDARIQLVCGTGSSRQTCTLDDPRMIQLLAELRGSADAVSVARDVLGLSSAQAERLLHQLVQRGVLVADAANASSWPDPARALHEATLDLSFESSDEAADNQQRWVDDHRDEPGSPPIYRIPDGPRRVPSPALAAVLVDTFATIDELDFAPWGMHARRTSPSLGARHPIDGFLVDATGIAQVDPRDGSLVQLSSIDRRAELDADLAIVLTIHWPRVMWKYRHPRYYSMAIFDAGHLCRTLELAAAAHGFVTRTRDDLDEPVVARLLGLDDLVDGPACLVALS